MKNTTENLAYYTVYSKPAGYEAPGFACGCVGWGVAVEVADNERAAGRQVWIEDDHGEVWVPAV